MIRVHFARLAVPWLLVLLTAGCAIIENDGKIGMVKGVENASLDRTYDATLKALEAMEFEVRRHNKDALVAQIEAYTADRKKITVDLDKEAEESTRVGIHIEPFGDETRSNLILSEIEKQLRQ